MVKAKNKTCENENSVSTFVSLIANPKRKADSIRLLRIFEEILPDKPKMWGSSIIGYGKYHYIYESGREGDLMKVGFSPRKQSMTLYIMPGFKRYEELMQKLGKFKVGKSCLYINKLEEIDEHILKELIIQSYNYMTQKYG